MKHSMLIALVSKTDHGPNFGSSSVPHFRLVADWISTKLCLVVIVNYVIIPYLLTLLGLISYAERQYFHT